MSKHKPANNSYCTPRSPRTTASGTTASRQKQRATASGRTDCVVEHVHDVEAPRKVHGGHQHVADGQREVGGGEQDDEGSGRVARPDAAEGVRHPRDSPGDGGQEAEHPAREDAEEEEGR